MELYKILQTTPSQPPIILAPMAGITDMPFRYMCNKFGCDFSYSEMISAKGLSYNNVNTFRLLDGVSKISSPFGIQIFGHEPTTMGETVRKLIESYPTVSIIDINMGCPAPKIVNDGNGSALMLDLKLTCAIIGAVKDAADGYCKPISVKFRKGYNNEHINAVEFAKAAQEAGASVLTIHGRTRTQMYSGVADLDIIAEVKNAVSIPVIGNGDITNGPSAAKMLKYTGCDGVMIGRGAEGNPFIFEEVKSYLCGDRYEMPSPEIQLRTALEHAMFHVEQKGEHSFIELRKHLAWYTKSLRGSAHLRNKICYCNSVDEVRKIFNDYISSEYADFS